MDAHRLVTIITCRDYKHFSRTSKLLDDGREERGAIMGSDVVTHTDVDHVGLAHAPGIVIDIADAMCQFHVAQFGLGHTTCHNIGTSGNTVPAVAGLTAGSDACGLGAMGGLGVIGSQRLDFFQGLKTGTGQGNPVHHDSFSRVVIGEIHRLDPRVTIFIT